MKASREVTLICTLDAQRRGYESAKYPSAANPYPMHQPALRSEWKAGRSMGIQAKRNDMINAKRGMM